MKDKCDTTEQTMSQLQVDVFCLQECSLPSNRDYALFKKWWEHGDLFRFGSNDSRSAGVAIVLKGDKVHSLQHTEIIAGRLLQVTCKIEGRKIDIVNAYVQQTRK